MVNSSIKMEASESGSCWSENKHGNEPLDSVAADLAAAITSTFMTKRDANNEPPALLAEPEISESISSETVQDASTQESDSFKSLETLKQYISSETVQDASTQGNDSFNSLDTLVYDLEPLNKSFSALPQKSASTDLLEFQEPQKTKMVIHLNRLLQDSSTGPFTVFVGKYKFNCHISILQIYSLYFLNYKDVATMTATLPVEKVSPASFATLYNWMVENKLNVQPDDGCNLVQLFSAASYLQIEKVVDFCWKITSDPSMVGSKAISLYLEACNWDIPKYKHLMLSRVGDFFMPFVASKEFVEMDVQSLCELLNLNNLGVNSEIEIFLSGVRWLSHKWSHRAIHKSRVMDCVRFTLLPPPFLRFLLGFHRTRVFNAICKTSKIIKTIYKVFTFTSSEYCETAIRAESDIEMEEQRNWIYNPQCPYHRQPAGNQGQFFTYEQFLNYLGKLQGTPPTTAGQGVLLKGPNVKATKEVCRNFLANQSQYQ